jgi:hypothetical protein
VRRATVLGLILLGLGACGSGGDKTFDEQGLKFTYPASFKAGKAVGAQPPGQVVGIVGASRSDYIAVRGRKGAGLPLDRLRASLPTIVAGVVPATVKAERHSKLAMVTAVQRPDASTEARIYFFNGGGRTWEIECRSTQPEREKIRSACAKAVDSIRIG